MSISQIIDWRIKIAPSENVNKYMSDFAVPKDEQSREYLKLENPKFSSKEKELLSKLSSTHQIFTETEADLDSKSNKENTQQKACDSDLNLKNLMLLHKKISEMDNEQNQYLHEILNGTKLILPENEIIPRNPVLEERCQKLKFDQENLEYANMTKNVDTVRKTLPEDTIAYQVKSINKQLIAIFQFVVSVITGFAFGFIGLELIFGGMDFGFRLLLGIICALVIALAEIYFLAKKLNEYDNLVDSPSHVMNENKKNN